MKDLSKSDGLSRLTQAVLTCSFTERRRDQLTSDHLEVLCGIVAHHVYNLPMFEFDVLVYGFGLCGQEIKPLKAIGKELGITEKETEKVAGEALGHLVDATWTDILKTLIDIENERA